MANGAFTSYGRKLLIDGLFVAPASVGTVYFAVTFVIPGTTDDATRLVEPGGNYGRVAYPFTSAWVAGSPGEVFNVNQITFPTPSSDWGTLRGWAAVTGPTGGKVIAAGPTKTPIPARLGMALTIAPYGIRAALR